MEIIDLHSENFAQETQHGTVLIDFWASWCTPCRMLAPILEEIAQAAPPDVRICKVNIDEQEALAGQFQVMSIPTLIVMKDGEVRSTLVGLQSKETIFKFIQDA